MIYNDLDRISLPPFLQIVDFIFEQLSYYYVKLIGEEQDITNTLNISRLPDFRAKSSIIYAYDKEKPLNHIINDIMQDIFRNIKHQYLSKNHEPFKFLINKVMIIPENVNIEDFVQSDDFFNYIDYVDSLIPSFFSNNTNILVKNEKFNISIGHELEFKATNDEKIILSVFLDIKDLDIVSFIGSSKELSEFKKKYIKRYRKHLAGYYDAYLTDLGDKNGE
jgi:hypothetical protein